MHSRTRSFVVIACATLAGLGLTARASEAQGLNGVIEAYFPTQAPRGQTTVVNVAMNGGRNNPVQSIQIMPSAGVTVGPLKAGDLKEGVIWWAVPITVAGDAAPGPRTLVAVASAGPTTPVTITIPEHQAAISDVKIVSAQTTGATVDFQFAATDSAGDLGDSPTVWFTLGCGGEPELGLVKGKASGGLVRASIPNPRTQLKPGAAPPKTRCDLQLRASDTKGFDSNTLKTVVEFK
jgi:hypothetical protein